MRFATSLFLLGIIATASAEDSSRCAAPLDTAHEAYGAGDYARVVALVEPFKVDEPECAQYAHLLGRAYGRLAENASWLQAVGYAKKSLREFENAVLLDPDNPEALEDLIKFYRIAPGFLGGDEKKAVELEYRLSRLLADNSRYSLPN